MVVQHSAINPWMTIDERDWRRHSRSSSADHRRCGAKGVNRVVLGQVLICTQPPGYHLDDEKGASRVHW
jgi:hypothetical protein